VSAATRAYWEHQFGYDQPLAVQYERYLSSVAHGRFGYSTSMNEPVSTAIAAALPRTLLLMGVALAVSLVLGIAVGLAQAVWRGSWFDRASGAVLLAFFSVPDFWLALIALLAFAYWWPVLPAGGIVDPVLHDYMGPWASFVDRARHLVLPALTLVLLTAAAIARYQRAAVLDVLPLDFVRTARAKGLRPRDVLARHVLRNALLPVITLVGLMLPVLVGGALFVEKVFAWPGMGFLVANAIGARDYDIVTAGVIIGGIMVAVGNLLADVLYVMADPRLRSR
jgi:peptide/nickel transport system permease protein